MADLEYWSDVRICLVKQKSPVAGHGGFAEVFDALGLGRAAFALGP